MLTTICDPSFLKVCGAESSIATGTASASSIVILTGGPLGFFHGRPRYTAGPRRESYSYTGRRSIWRVYQSVLSSDRQATITSFLIPSTSWAYHSGNVSLSPAVTRIPYGSTEFRRSTAKSAVSVCPAREADFQFANNGITASASTGAEISQLRRVG